ncbi:hypothetical protein IIC65_02595, partial [Candidatus Sumerlaeota bacterium]|nr:hypothetical protein [Candidatus Sumerlaeota bacterium]
FQTRLFKSARRPGGFALLGMMIVLLIIMILVGNGYLKRDPNTGITQAETYINRASGAACTADRAILGREITMMLTSSGGKLPSINILRVKFSGNYCPEGGTFQIDDKGNVYCADHFPPPDGVSVSNLQE